jgi:hypothetical protein
MMVIGRLRPHRKSKYGTKSGRPKAPPRHILKARANSSPGRPSNSLLEQLPIELLQDIFLFSANLILPLCSKQLLGALTSNHLKYEITLQILVYQRDKLEHNNKSLLLTRRFFTWDFVVRYVRFASTRIAIDVLDSEVDDDSPPDNDEGDTTTERSTSRPPSRSGELSQPLDLHQLEMSLSDHAINRILDRRRRATSTHIDMKAETDLEHLRLQETQTLLGLKGLDLPGKLLHHGWSDNRLRLLRLLIAFKCTVSASSEAEVAADEGILEAIAREDEEVVSHLLSSQIGVKPTIVALREAMKRTNMSILHQLLSGAHDELDHLDPQVWKLLDGHLGLERGKKATLQRWLREGVQDAEEEEYLPRLRAMETGR